MRDRLSIAALALTPLLALSSCGPRQAEPTPPPDRRETLDSPPIAFGDVDRRRRSDEPASQSSPSLAEPTEASAPLPGLQRSIDRALTGRVETAVANAVERARKKSEGKVTARDVVVSVYAVDATSGRVLLDRSADVPLVPASNLKLLTAAAALVTLGSAGEFVTRFETDARVEGGVLEGDLVVRAGGDPLYRREGDGSLDAWLDPLAAGLRDAGIERIAGTITLDEGGWLVPGPGPEWPAPSQFWTDYCAFSGAFSANGSCFRATITPTSPGAEARTVLRPRHHGLTRNGRVVTEGKTLDIRIGATRAGVTVGGSLPASNPLYVAEFSHPDPVDLFGHSIVGGLMDRGILVAGGFARSRDVALQDARTLHVMRTPITSVLDAILLDSNNPVADQLFLASGASIAGAGTRESGAEAVRRALRALQVEANSLVQVDGSGLSKANRVTAEQLANLVTAVVRGGGDTRDAIVGNLPVAATSGSLSKRMRGTPAEGRVRAKTGWVMGASGLSGIAESLDGRDIVFSILVRYPRAGGLNNAAWKPMQDEICVALVESGTFEAGR
ncbi:MAG: D-alanyl-D-alanine carboxypeptidase/D-alanyl-D-alanine-endopeptidase [Planctomycetota bacterium]